MSISAKTLVVYYSYTGNCQEIVESLKTQIDADVMRIEPADKTQKYEANNYAIGTSLLNTIKAAPNDAASYPAIDPVSITDLSGYQNIIIVTPLWWSQMAAIMQTYLFNYGAMMAGKQVSLIVSSYSSGISKVVDDAKRLVPNAVWTGDALWINNSNRSNTASLLSEWLSTWRDKKIVVLSDPHVMSPKLLVGEGDAWTDYLSGQRKMVDYSKSLFDEMVAKIKDEIKPDLVLITGDLTKDGEQLSHKYVISKLDELRGVGIQTLVIPGNHDRGDNEDAVSYDGATTTPIDVATDDWFATEYTNYGYGSSSERESSTLTYVCEPIEGLVVIGIDSGTDGTLSTTTLNWIVGKASAAQESGKRVIAMMHHPLIPHVTNAESLVPTYVISDHDNIRKALIDAGVKVIFTGHFHTSDIAKDFDDQLTKEIYDVNTGSLISYPCDYREVSISGNLSELGLTTGHITSLSSDETFTSEYALTRLHDSVKKAVKEKITAKLGAAAAFMASTIETMADNVADAFIIHAEGNEADVDTEDIMSALSSAFTVMPGTEAMCRSMLEDKAPYGEEGRENVTDDLSLTVKMADKYKLIYQIGDELIKTVELANGSKILQTWIYVAPSKEGHTFSGWSEIPESMPAQDVTITGSYTVNNYKLTYVVDDETYKTIEVAYGSSITLEENPSKEGHTFSGWSEIPETMPASDVTITGSYTINKYKLIYQVDDETYMTVEIAYGSSITPEENPSKEGYTFSGWSEIPETMPASDVTITGSYTVNKYKLTYVVDDETYKTIELAYGSSITPEENPSKKGYTFSGWSEIPETMPAQDVTIAGTYTVNKYKLIYQLGDETYKTVELAYGSSITPEENPSQEGHTFSGWIEIPEMMPAHDVTVSGSYTVNKYKLTYMIGDETYKTIEIAYGSSITPEEDPSKEGYTFSGWSEIPETMLAQDVTITGHFSLLGDANGDGVVNVADIVELISKGDVDDDDINTIIAIIMSSQ